MPASSRSRRRLIAGRLGVRKSLISRFEDSITPAPYLSVSILARRASPLLIVRSFTNVDLRSVSTSVSILILARDGLIRRKRFNLLVTDARPPGC